MRDPTEPASSAPPPEDRDGGAGRGRISTVPPLPDWPRPEFAILEERRDALGAALWQLRRDVLLWCAAAPGERGGVFPPRPPEVRQAWADTLAAEPELVDAGRELLEVSGSPGAVPPGRVAEACDAVYRWAELRGLHETALQFAEAAAHAQPDVSLRSYVPGRLCRLAGEPARAELWFRRAVALARQASREKRTAGLADYATARLGWGNLELDRGRLAQAERHFRKAALAALRRGNKGLAAAAYHNLMLVAIEQEQFDIAIEYAKRAVATYPVKHPRIPALVFDAGLLLMHLGHFSTALHLFEAVRPWVGGWTERILLYSGIARCGAAVRDLVRWSRGKTQVMELVANGNRYAQTALYQLAEGATALERWEEAAALATEAANLAAQKGNALVVRAAHKLMREIATRAPAKEDVVPAEGSPMDTLTITLIARLQKQAPSQPSSATEVFPEKYPDD